MAKRKQKDEDEQKKPGVHDELEGFDIKINEFGEITSSLDVEKVNQFLDQNVEDKKLKGRKPSDEEE